jgi:hypothetical protein
MKLEIVIKHHLFALPKITVPIGDAPAIGNIDSLSIPYSLGALLYPGCSPTPMPTTSE